MAWGDAQRRWLENPENLEKHRAAVRERMREKRATPEGRAELLQRTRDWLAIGDNRARLNARRRARRLDPEVRQEALERMRAWYATPEGFAMAKAGNRRRRARRAGVAIVFVDSIACALCGGPLDHSLAWPHPMSVSVGHEPPLARAVMGSTVVERLEHLVCNLKKHTSTDAELAERREA